MPWGGDYSGFGLRGQERRKRFDLRAEAEPPSPSARVTHRGCGWEVDPERGLNQATGPGAGVWSGGRSRLSVAGETRGTRRAGQWRMQGSWTARRSHPLDLACRFRRRWDPLPQAGAGAGGVELPRRLLRVAPKVCGGVHVGQGARRSRCAFCFGYRQAGLGHRAFFPAWGEECRSRGSRPRGSAGQKRPTTAGSGMRRAITFSRPCRTPRLPDSSLQQSLRAAFGFFLACPCGVGDTFLLGGVRFTLRPTIQHRDTQTRCLTQEDVRKRRKTRYFLPVGKK